MRRFFAWVLSTVTSSAVGGGILVLLRQEFGIDVVGYVVSGFGFAEDSVMANQGIFWILVGLAGLLGMLFWPFLVRLRGRWRDLGNDDDDKPGNGRGGGNGGPRSHVKITGLKSHDNEGSGLVVGDGASVDAQDVETWRNKGDGVRVHKDQEDSDG